MALSEKRKAYEREYRRNNPDKVRSKFNDWYYRPGNKEKVLTKNRLYRANLSNTIKDNFRRRINHALCGNKLSLKNENILGCDIETYKEYLELLFEPGMTWENRGEWVIDHIMPLSLFNLEDEEQMKISFHFSNTQPLWAQENGIKSTKMSPVVQIVYNNLNFKEA
jgi:hypothetical protein